MIGILIWLLISALAVFVIAEVLPGVRVASYGTALAVAVVLGLLNFFVWPLLIVLTLPINILTLGLFTFVLMALFVMLASKIVDGFQVDSFWWALGFSIVLTLINILFGGILL